MTAQRVLKCLFLTVTILTTTIADDDREWELFNIAVKKWSATGRIAYKNIILNALSQYQHVEPTPGLELTCKDENDQDHPWLSANIGGAALPQKYVPSDDTILPFSHGTVSGTSNVNIKKSLCNTLRQTNANGVNGYNITKRFDMNKPLTDPNHNDSYLYLVYNFANKEMLTVVTEARVELTSLCSDDPPLVPNTFVCVSSPVIKQLSKKFDPNLHPFVKDPGTFLEDWENFNFAVQRWAALARDTYFDLMIANFTAIQNLEPQPFDPPPSSVLTCKDENNDPKDWVSAKVYDDHSTVRKFEPVGGQITPFSGGQFSDLSNQQVQKILCHTLSQPGATNPALHKLVNRYDPMVNPNISRSNGIILFNTVESQMLALLSVDPIDILSVCSDPPPTLSNNTLVCVSGDYLNHQDDLDTSKEGGEGSFQYVKKG